MPFGLAPRHYALGFLRNRPGFAFATVFGLDPGASYVWKVYQFASAAPGNNHLWVQNQHQGVARSRECWRHPLL